MQKAPPNWIFLSQTISDPIYTAVLKLGVATLFRVAKCFFRGCQTLLGLTNYLGFVVVCEILGSQKFCKYLERVAVQKSLRTPALTE